MPRQVLENCYFSSIPLVPNPFTMADITTAGGERDEWEEKKGGVGVDVQVVASQQIPAQNSRRERAACVTKSIFKRETLNSVPGVLWKFARFAGPGAVISVAYVDPDNLQSNITSGAEFRFKLLFMILFSNVIAVFLQVSASRLKR